MPSYRRLQQYAIGISILSVLYNGAEGGISIGFGAESSSRSLIFFGIQSVIEVVSAAVVIWRFKRLAKPGEERQVVLAAQEIWFERRATLIIGILLLLLFLGTEVTSIASLALHHKPDPSNSSLIISASALLIMILIWLPKRYLAKALDSSAMKGEARCSLSCIQITIVLFTGALVFRLWKGGWWVDSATGIVLGFLFGWEGLKMIRWARDPEFSGGCCKECEPVELEEGYKDICDCCLEKAECRESDKCKCQSADTKDTCCTRGMLRKPRTRNTVHRYGCCTEQREAPVVMT